MECRLKCGYTSSNVMKLDGNFVPELVAVSLVDFFEQMRSDNRPNFDTHWTLTNELRPVDLYCYLHARFGPPNGFQNLLRADHSENLIHWEWALCSQGRILLIQGQNFRTDIWLSGDELHSDERDVLIAVIKDTFTSYSLAMGKIRKELEHWVEFVNPYQRIRRSIESLINEIDTLDIGADIKEKKDFCEHESSEAWAEDWRRISNKFSRATGLCFGIRSMLPVMAESFVNLLVYMLMKPALKNDNRLRENYIRQPIDVRIKLLSNNCIGFKSDIDYSDEACKRYHSLVNERNDLLHGNVSVDKLKFNEIYFSGRIPVFKSYSTMWERAFGVAQESVGLDLIKQDLATVENLIKYIISCLEDVRQEKIKFIIAQHELGICSADNRLGVLFSGNLIDIKPGPKISN